MLEIGQFCGFFSRARFWVLLIIWKICLNFNRRLDISTNHLLNVVGVFVSLHVRCWLCKQMKHKQQTVCLKHAYILSYLIYMLLEIVPCYISLKSIKHPGDIQLVKLCKCHVDNNSKRGFVDFFSGFLLIFIGLVKKLIMLALGCRVQSRI